MSFADTVRAWLSPKPTASDAAEQKLRVLFRASLEMMSTYAAVLESKPPTMGLKQSETDLPFSKQQIMKAAGIVQMALGQPRLRAIVIQGLSPMEAQQVLSSEFAENLEPCIALLDDFVPIAEVEAERKQWDEVYKLLGKVDPAAQARFESRLADAQRGKLGKNKATISEMSFGFG